ncbi:MAG: hypothetical protein IJX13_06985 [Clostridia bacterium]|nr:hypothetical protein [Clostridia bacterium]
MKKLLTLLLVLVMVFPLLTSCIDPSTPPNGGSSEESDTTETTTPDNEESSKDDTTESTTPGSEETSGNDSTESTTPDDEDPPLPPTYLNTAFKPEDATLFLRIIGETIPFLPNNQYTVEELSDEYGPYINFYTYGNTKAEFNAYLSSLTGYVLTGTEVDEFGDTWYYYEKGDICIEIGHYETEDGSVVDAYIYLMSGTGDGSGDDSGNSDPTPDNVDLITNDGKGLPTDADGVHEVDFTGATNVKDVTDQGYYLDGCPTVGSPTVLVIPVEFSDATAASKGFDIAKLHSAFASNNSTDGFWSVYEYYHTSSYGQLKLDFTVVDQWFRPKYNSTYYASSTDSEGYANGDQLVIDEALAYLSTFMDLSEFDSDGNAIIDAIVIVHTLHIDDSNNFYWAYRYWNYHVDEDGYYYEYDGVSANDFLWASFDFLHESYDQNGNVDYTDQSGMNTYTFIHEFGHVLGADDYYDTSYSGNESPLSGMDVMDGMLGDHNAYTKFNFGWLTTSRLVVCDGSITLTLEEFSKNGDTILLANNWDDALGAYQEYYILVYYTATGLNAGKETGYFDSEGIVVYHVNASLYCEVYDGEPYYDVYNNNTDPSDEYGTENNLIEFVKSAEDTYTYTEGDTMGWTYDDAGNPLSYNFVVDSLENGVATLTFTKA